jgi:hypothetical protein
MKNILASHPELIHDLGLRLAALGAELLAGKLDEAIANAQAAAQQYPEWAALDQATVAIDSAVRERTQTDELRAVLMELVWAVVAESVREAVH